MMRSVLIFAIIFTLNVKAQDNPTLYLIGDSTMSDKKDPEENPEHGWGQVLPELLSSDLKIENHAVNGRSTKSFIAEGRWDSVRKKLKSGDFVFIQFGHNDQKNQDPQRFTNPFTQYRANLETFVSETREKGAIPVLFTSIVRRNFNDAGVLEDTHGNYPLVVRMVADDYEVDFVDLQTITEQLEIYFGKEKSKNLHLHFEPGEHSYYPEGKHDDTHLSRKGAELVAIFALKELAKQKFEITEYILPEVLLADLEM